MRFNLLIGLLFSCCFLFISCDDDLRSVGGNIQPDGDDVLLEVDSINVKARTILMTDSVYVPQKGWLLGKYEDGFSGTIRAEYLCEFFCPDSLSFGYDDTYEVDRIDSTKMLIKFHSYVGDSIAPMGLSLYQLNSRLKKDYYTNLDVSKYCDLSKPLGATAYTIKGLPYEGTASKVRIIETDMGDWGQKLYDASVSSNNPMNDYKDFLNYFPGVYVKSSFGTGSLVEVIGSSICVYYTTKKDTTFVTDTVNNVEIKKDSVMYKNKLMYLANTSEVLYLNKVENKVPANMLTEGTGAVYIKSPAGTCVELELPIKDIIDGSAGRTINMARIRLKGYTELEQKESDGLSQAPYLLMINKDSVQSFFENPRRLEDLSSSLIYAAARNTSSNTYEFNNLAPMINEYKKKELRENPKFVLVPVTLESIPIAATQTTVGYFNSMKPRLTILRAKEGDIKMEMIYSTF